MLNKQQLRVKMQKVKISSVARQEQRLNIADYMLSRIIESIYKIREKHGSSDEIIYTLGLLTDIEVLLDPKKEDISRLCTKEELADE